MSHDKELYGLAVKTVKQIQQVLSGFPEISSAILYGSRAKGNYRPGSDIDLTLTTNGDGELHLLTGIMNALNDLNLPYRFDISFFQQIKNDNLIDHINRVGITFYKKTTKTKSIGVYLINL